MFDRMLVWKSSLILFVDTCSNKWHNFHRMNSEILGAMLRQGCCHFNFEYVLAIMETVIEEEVQPSEKFLDNLENFHKDCQRKIRNQVSCISDPKRFESSSVEQFIFDCYKIRKFFFKKWLIFNIICTSSVL